MNLGQIGFGNEMENKNGERINCTFFPVHN